MIRNFELFCKLKHIKLSELTLFHQTISSFCPALAICPFCGAKGALQNHGSYTRFLVVNSERTFITELITIPRYICSCGHTHAILPACLIPHGSYSLLFILSVLRTYFLRLVTVAAICDAFGIAISTLYAWLKLFRSHKTLWLGILSDLSSSEPDFLALIFNESCFLQRFFSLLNASFLQGVSLAALSHRSALTPVP